MHADAMWLGSGKEENREGLYSASKAIRRLLVSNTMVRSCVDVRYTQQRRTAVKLRGGTAKFRQSPECQKYLTKGGETPCKQCTQEVVASEEH